MNYYIETVHMTDKMHKNCLRFSSAESQEHILTKLKICQYLKDNCIDFITECRFKRGGRADIYILKNNKSIEILKTEKDTNIVIKQNKYPGEIIIYDLKNPPKNFENWAEENLKTINE